MEESSCGPCIQDGRWLPDWKLLTNFDSNFAKVYEELLYVDKYFRASSYFSTEQHGFVRAISTVTNLTTMAQYITERLDDAGQVVVVYTDLSRAFDSVDHDILLKKISPFGFSPAYVKLIGSYLEDRINYVFYNGCRSLEYVLSYGVSQGSNLGPLFFIMYINDLLTSLECHVLAFAVDLKSYLKILSSDDLVLLQSSLEYINSWCLCNKLMLNMEKCFKVTFSRRSHRLTYRYHIADNYAGDKDQIYDFGVLFDSTFSFIPHFEELCASDSRTLGFVLRCGNDFSDLSNLRCLYFTLVISKLEYAHLIWFPIYDCHLVSLTESFSSLCCLGGLACAYT